MKEGQVCGNQLKEIIEENELATEHPQWVLIYDFSSFFIKSDT